MQIVGARSMLADLAFTSSARWWPTSRSRPLFQVAARETPQGNRAAWCSRVSVGRRARELSTTIHASNEETHLSSADKDASTRTIRTISRLDRRNFLVRDRLGSPEIGRGEEGDLFLRKLVRRHYLVAAEEQREYMTYTFSSRVNWDSFFLAESLVSVRI